MVAWHELQSYFDKSHGSLKIPRLFKADPERHNKFSITLNDVFFDYSKQLIDQETLDRLIMLYEEASIETRLTEIFNGEQVNHTEKHSALHYALRADQDSKIGDGIRNVVPLVTKHREKMKTLSEKIRNGNWHGSTGRQIKNVICIGIGGSNLGPEMILQALAPFRSGDLNIGFVNNIDPASFINETFAINPAETLFVVTTKSFKTEETLANAKMAEKWLAESIGESFDKSKHFIGISGNKKAVMDFGIIKENWLYIPEWVGGRFSVSGTAGLPIAIGIGYDKFSEFLDGLKQVDEHVKNSPVDKNIPAIMALISIWYRNFYHSSSEAVIPYAQDLKLLPSYLQQLFMESNGKVATSDDFVDYATGYVVWGSQGTSAQHSFFQLLHQGNSLIPVDLIGFSRPVKDVSDHHSKLLANMLAQSHVLAYGRKIDDIKKDLKSATTEQVRHRYMVGNRPSTTILIDSLTPQSMGELLGLYEYKAIIQGLIWNINSFDQFGVEMGKKIAVSAEAALKNQDQKIKLDPSTDNLIGRINDRDQDSSQ